MASGTELEQSLVPGLSGSVCHSSKSPSEAATIGGRARDEALQ